MFGFIVMGPLSGWLSDRFGSRLFATLGMSLMVVGFLGLTLLPANFSYAAFLPLLVLLGIGGGIFAAPNTVAIMNGGPGESGGVASGMRSPFQTAAPLLSIGVFFSIATAGLASGLPTALQSGLTQAGLPVAVAGKVAHLPPTAALFAAFLGYNPLATLLPPPVVHTLPAASQASLFSQQFFPSLIAGPFMTGLHAVFYIAAGMCVVSAVAFYLRGEPPISRVRTPPVGQGLEAPLNRRPPTRTYVRKLDGVQEAKLIALACAQPPAGQARWSLRLLADKLVEREIVEHAVSYQTVRRMLQKTRSSRTRGSSALVHPARGQRRVRLAQGRRPRRLYSPPLPVPLAGLPGRDRETVAPRHAGGTGARTGPSSTRGRCVRARGRRLAGAAHRLHLHGGLALHHRRRPHQALTPLSINSGVTSY